MVRIDVITGIVLIGMISQSMMIGAASSSQLAVAHNPDQNLDTYSGNLGPRDKDGLSINLTSHNIEEDDYISVGVTYQGASQYLIIYHTGVATSGRGNDLPAVSTRYSPTCSTCLKDWESAEIRVAPQPVGELSNNILVMPAGVSTTVRLYPDERNQKKLSISVWTKEKASGEWAINLSKQEVNPPVLAKSATEERVQTLQARLDDKNETIDSLESQLQQKNQHIDSLETRLQERNQTIASLRSTIEQREAKIKSLRSQLSTKENTVKSLRSTIETKEKRIKELNQKLAALRNQNKTSIQNNRETETTYNQTPGFGFIVGLLALVGFAFIRQRAL